MKSAPWHRAFDMQMELWLRTSSTSVEEKIAAYRAIGGEVDDKAAEQTVHALTKTLFLADPFFVSADMCQLIEAAHRTFKPEPFQASDFLSPCGFLWFDRPVVVPLADGAEPIGFCAFTWIYLAQDAASEDTPVGIVLSVFNSEPPNDDPVMQAFKLVRFGEPPDEGTGWWPLMQTTLRLMAEFRPASRYSARPERAARRRAKRLKFPEREVTVVRLRRERASSERLGGTADYRFRFMVSGHWRNQWFPSLGEHRQVWIAPYVKGPDEKPFRPPHGRAFTFDR